MSSDSTHGPDSLYRKRVPLERKISLKFKEFRGFLTEYSANISLGGMYVRTLNSRPPGTVFDFELTLGDDYTLIQGKGEVVWVRELGEGPERPAGMGVRFLDLDEQSRELILRIVQEHVASGGTPFDPDLEPPEAAAEEPPPTAPEPAPPSALEATVVELPKAPAATLAGATEKEGPPAEEPVPERPEPAATPPPRPEPPPPTTSPLGRPPLPTVAAVARRRPPWVRPALTAAAALLVVGGFWWLYGVLPKGQEPAAATPPRPPVLPGAALRDEAADAAGTAGGAETAGEAGTSRAAAAGGPGDTAPTKSREPIAETPAEGNGSPTAGDLVAAGPVAGGAVTFLEAIDWRERPGGLLVILTGDGDFERTAYNHFRLGGDAPREVVRILGVDRPFRPPEMAVGTPEVVRIRTGHHPKPSGDELHVVFDLGTPEVFLVRLEAQGDRLLVHLARSG